MFEDVWLAKEAFQIIQNTSYSLKKNKKKNKMLKRKSRDSYNVFKWNVPMYNKLLYKYFKRSHYPL